MPELPVKDVRLPELRLPEISRDEILRTLSEVRRPEIEIDPTRITVPEVHLPRVSLSAVDIASLATTAAAAIGLGRPRVSRPGRGLLIGVVAVAAVAAVTTAVAVAVARNEAARRRIDGFTHELGERVEAIRARRAEVLEVEPDDAVDLFVVDLEASSTGIEPSEAETADAPSEEPTAAPTA